MENTDGLNAPDAAEYAEYAEYAEPDAAGGAAPTLDGKSGWERRLWLFAALLFCISLLFRFFLADYPKFISTYPDELRYFSIARSIMSGNGMTIYNLPTDFQKILYPILILPAFFAHDTATQFRIIAMINSAAISSGVFPVAVFAKKILTDKRHVALLCLLYMVISDMTFSMVLMSEVIFLPLGLWTVYGFYVLMSGAGKRHRRLCAALGALIYLLYLDKEIALVFPIAYALYVLTAAAARKRGRDLTGRGVRAEFANLLIMALSFAACFVIMKLTLFAGLGNSYNQSSPDILLLPGRIRYMLYGFVYYLAYALIGFGFFPIALPALQFRRLAPEERRLYLFLVYLLVVSAAVVAYTITVREDFDIQVPRAHLRYICYLLIPFLILFFRRLEARPEISGKRLAACALIVAGVFLSLLTFYRGAHTGSDFDQTLLAYQLDFSQTQAVIFVAAGALLLSAATVLIYRRPRAACAVLVCAFMAVQVVNNVKTARIHWSDYTVTHLELRESEILNSLMRREPDKNYVLLGTGFTRIQKVLDAYLDTDNLYTVSINLLCSKETADGTDLSSDRLYPLYGDGVYDLHTADYLIVPGGYTVEQGSVPCEKLECGLRYYDVYELKNNTVVPYVRKR